VAQPIELLRAGVAFHARGLVNNRVIQHNLDWVWPYWVERQFDPRDDAFVPRGFSITQRIEKETPNWPSRAGTGGRRDHREVCGDAGTRRTSTEADASEERSLTPSRPRG
jgi:hypothetical protein